MNQYEQPTIQTLQIQTYSSNPQGGTRYSFRLVIVKLSALILNSARYAGNTVKYPIILFVLILAGCIGVQLVQLDKENNMQFQVFTTEFGRQYQNAVEKDYRMGIFYQNLKNISEHNLKSNTTYTKGINQFSDYTYSQFKEMFYTVKTVGQILKYIPQQKQKEKTVKQRSQQEHLHPIIFQYGGIMFLALKIDDDSHLIQTKQNEVPDTYQYQYVSSSQSDQTKYPDVNWRSKMPNIKNQFRCLSCFAFPTVGSVEALYSIKTGVVRAFSQQQIIDCALGKDGCKMGSVPKAFQYIIKQGIQLESQYPYTSHAGIGKKCSANKNKQRFKISKQIRIKRGDCRAVEAALSIQPLAVVTDISGWNDYQGGILDSCGQEYIHGVVLVGKTEQYWLIRNSWGLNWGEMGHIKLSRGNTCGICNYASFPIQ